MTQIHNFDLTRNLVINENIENISNFEKKNVSRLRWLKPSLGKLCRKTSIFVAVYRRQPLPTELFSESFLDISSSILVLKVSISNTGTDFIEVYQACSISDCSIHAFVLSFASYTKSFILNDGKHYIYIFIK